VLKDWKVEYGQGLMLTRSKIKITLFLGSENEFEIVDPLEYDALGLPYDYGSIMHYNQLEFSRNNQPTIISKDPQWQTKMGINLIPSSMVKETEAKTFVLKTIR